MKTLGIVFCSLFLVKIIIILVADTQPKAKEVFVEEIDACPEQLITSGSKNEIIRSWQYYNTDEYCVAYTTKNSLYLEAKKNRNNYNKKEPHYYKFWGKLYKEYYENDKLHFTEILDSLATIRS